MDHEAHKAVEAQWVWQEKHECVKLIQQYRALYLTGVFVALGWVLGQAVGSSQSPSPAIADFQRRKEVAVLLCVVPFLNAVFVLLMLETYAQMISLARYLFVLGFEPGRESPGFRWELWKNTGEGSTLSWITSLNAASVLVSLGLSLGALAFCFPAAWGDARVPLKILWSASALSAAFTLYVLARTGIARRRANPVASPPTTFWDDLWPTAGESSKGIAPQPIHGERKDEDVLPS